MLKLRRIFENTAFWYLLFGSGLAIFTALSLARIHQMLAADDFFLLVSATTLQAEGVPRMFWSIDKGVYCDHPFLYVYILSWAFNLLGSNEVTARLIGIMSGLASIALVFLIAKRFSAGSEHARTRMAAIVSFLYALAPTTIQSTTILHIDNTLLVPAVLFLFWAAIKYFQEKRAVWLFAVSLAAAFSFWLRLSTPSLLVFVLITHVFLLNKDALKVKLAFTGAVILGILVFMLSWYLYCRIKGFSFLGPLEYTFSSVSSAGKEFLLPRILKNTADLVLWTGFFPALVVAIILLRKYKALFRAVDIRPSLIFISGFILVAIYSVFGGTNFGFPRYHSAGLALLYIGIGLILSKGDFEGLNFKNTLFILSVSLFTQFFIIGDLLYIFRYVLRDHAVFALASEAAVLKYTVIRLLAASLIYGMLCLKYRKIFLSRSVLGFLVVLSASSTLAITLLQSKAHYNTGYNYGAYKTQEAAEHIAGKMPAGSIVIGPRELIYYMRLADSPLLLNPFWQDRNGMVRSLKDPKVSAFVYSTCINTVDQVRGINDDGVIQEILRSGFDYARIGSYNIWTRIR